MKTEKTKGGEKAKSGGSSFGPMGRGMSELMKKCCAGRGGFPGCETGMEAMMEEMKKHCCTPDEDAAEAERKKK